jgi:glycosyltransferase involved in cell wall biosynthesis
MRPRVSVTMASYNGAKYIAKQISSILSQLSSDDEMVIIDDGSKDDTVDIIQSFGDPRIRLGVLTYNRGVVKTFNDALTRSTGEIIFLADQDDIWFPGKVQTILQAFADNPMVNIVSTDAVVIDENGNQTMPSYYADRGGFTCSVWPNLIKSRFHGCLMAFRAKLLPLVLPLAPHHDVWIGLCNTLAGGEAILVPRPYVAYRRHGRNESAPLSLDRQIAKRTGLVGNLLLHLPRLRRTDLVPVKRIS